jgi:mRNA interferase RelE/StbE
VASYSVIIKPSATKEIEDIDSRKIREKIVERIYGLALDPRPLGSQKLSGTPERYRIRQGDFRILYEVHDEVLVVYIVKVGNRKDVYRR